MVRARNPRLFHAHSIFRLILGIVIVLFFKSIAALFDPVHRRGEPIKRGLVSYTVVMFLLVTVGTGMQLDVQSISYIDNRGFPGVEGVIPPGPVGYQELIQPEPIDFVQNIVFALSNWLADGFLVSSLFDAVFTRPMPDVGSSSFIAAMLFIP